MAYHVQVLLWILERLKEGLGQKNRLKKHKTRTATAEKNEPRLGPKSAETIEPLTG